MWPHSYSPSTSCALHTPIVRSNQTTHAAVKISNQQGLEHLVYYLFGGVHMLTSIEQAQEDAEQAHEDAERAQEDDKGLILKALKQLIGLDEG